MAFQPPRTLSDSTSTGTSTSDALARTYPLTHTDIGTVADTASSSSIGVFTDAFAYSCTLPRPAAAHTGTPVPVPVPATLTANRIVMMPPPLPAATDPRVGALTDGGGSTGTDNSTDDDGSCAGGEHGYDSGTGHGRDAIVPVPVVERVAELVPAPAYLPAATHTSVPLPQPFAVPILTRNNTIALSMPIAVDESSDTSALIPGNAQDSENSEGSAYIAFPDPTSRTDNESDSARVGIFATFRAHGWRAARIYMFLALITYLLTFLAIYVTGAAAAALLIVAQVPFVGKPIAAKAEQYPEWIVPLSAHAVNQIWEPLRAAATVALLRRS